MVKVNGEDVKASGRTVADYLASSGYDAARIAIELNGAVLPRARYGETVLAPGDEVEVVTFVGGG